MKKYPKIQPFAEDAYKSFVREEVLNPLILQHNGIVDDVEALYNKSQVVDGEILAMEASVATMEGKVVAVEETEAAQAEAIAAITADLEVLATQIEETPGRLTALEEKAVALTDEDVAIKESIELVDKKATGLGNIVSNFDNIQSIMDQRLTDAEESIVSSKSSIISLERKSNVLDGKVGTAERDILAVERSVDLIKDEMSTVGIRLASNEAGIERNKDHISQVSDEMCVVQDKLKDLELAIENCEGGSGEGGSGGEVDLTPVLDRLTVLEDDQVVVKDDIAAHTSKLDDLDSITADHETRVAALEAGSGDGSTPPPVVDKEITKFFVLPIGGQSNAVGYGEMPYDLDGFDKPHPRIKQLGRYELGATAGGAVITKASTGYGAAYDDLRPYDDCNLKVIPAVPNLDHTQNMFQHQVGGTAGWAFPLAKMLLPYIPEDYGILIIPCARGGSAFTKGSDGSWDASKKRASESSSRWGVGKPLGKDFLERTKHALSLNADNRLLPIMWAQGEHDAPNWANHYTAFKAYFDHFLDDIISSGYLNRIPDARRDNFRWMCFSSTKWMLGANTVLEWGDHNSDLHTANSRLCIYNNYARLMNETKTSTGSQITYTRIDINSAGKFTETNRESGNGITTSTREIHFSTHAVRSEIPPIMFNALSRYSPLSLPGIVGMSSRKVMGGKGYIMSDGTRTNRTTMDIVTDRINEGLLIHHDWSTGGISENLAAGSSITPQSPTGMSLVADDDYGRVCSFNAGKQTYAIDKGVTSFTQAFTVKLPDNPDAGNIFSASTNDNTDGVFWGDMNGIIWYPTYTSGKRYSLIIAPCLENVWHGGLRDWQHVVASYNKETGLCKLYCNGVLVSAMKAAEPLKLQRRTLGGYGTSSGSFRGSLANMRVYERTLSDGEVLGLYYADFKEA